MGLGILLPFVSFLVFSNIEALLPYTPKAFLLSCGLPFCVMGIDYILGCLFKFDHMVLIHQDCSRQKMDPYDLKWNVPEKTYIAIGIVFFVLGAALVVLSFFI